MRVLIAVTHLLGAGHLTRAAALARAFAAAGHEAVLASGGMPAPLIALGGARLVQLPPLRVAGTDFARLLTPEGEPADAAYLDARRARLLDALAETAPDAVITELFPFGRRALAGEFLALVEAARARRPRPVVLASVRDVLVAPEKPERIAQAHARVAALYDGVLVHGDPGLIALDASWPLDAATAARLAYTGYVDEGAPATPTDARAGILVSAGSSAAGLGLLAAAAEAARRWPDLGWRILAGHGVPDPDFAALGRGLDGVVARARPDYRALLARAALSVSQCGYNTAVDLLATGTPAVLVPFEAGRETEQRLRAGRLAARGLARVLPEVGIGADALLDAVAVSLAAGPPPSVAIDLGGAARTVAIVEAMAARHVPGAPAEPRPPCPDALFTPLRAALDAAAEAGTPVPVWWRDDDAVAPTPALERLLALAAAHGLPLLLAVIPARAGPALAERVAQEARVHPAVHGLAHDDHAPPGARAAEFGAHRPLAALRADAARALDLAHGLFGARLLPVFVPPWNRIAPELAAALPGLGYAGLSAAEGPPVPGLARADATLDPIDWRGTRSLRDPRGLVAALAEHIRSRPGLPVGLLTHHLVHDAAVWDFVGALLSRLSAHPAVRPADPRDLFAPRTAAPARG